ncbi:MAG: hypothetical protein ACLUD0_07150 [Eubacterium ramulus]
MQEYYRVRVGAEKIYLLNFDRPWKKFSRETVPMYPSDSINLGIRPDVVESSKANETEILSVFVQQGERVELLQSV